MSTFIHSFRYQRELAKLSIDIALQQRNRGRLVLDFDALECRDDTVTVDIPRHWSDSAVQYTSI